jgi:hypothetical protein
MRQSLFALFVLIPFLVVTPASAEGEANDHLKCRRIEAGTKIKKKAAIEGLDERFDAGKCRVQRARLLCSATARTGIDPSPELEFVEGDELGSDYVCYKTKCKNRPEANVATDAFGTRRIGKLQSKLLCVPTIEEAPAA